MAHRLCHRGRDGQSHLVQRLQLIRLHSGQRILWHLAGNNIIKCCRQRVHIGPGILVALLGILLRRGKPGFQQHAVLLFAIFHALSCRAKINELNFCSAKQNINILRANVPVQNMAGVHLLQRPGRFHNIVPGQSRIQAPAVALDIRFQIAAIQVFHHQIGSVILLKMGKNLHNTLHILKLIQGFDLINIADFAALKNPGCLSIAGDRHHLTACALRII